MKTLSLAVVLLAATSPAQDVDPRATELDRRIMAELRGRHSTKHARLHWDPATVTDAQRDAAAADIEAGFATLDRIFAQRYQGTILVFLYADGADLQKRTGTRAVAFSTGTVSLHMPHEFRGVHELTHLFALQFPKSEDAVSDLFVVEGLATMLAESDENVPIHAWAATYLQAGRLPDLLELRRTFPEGAAKGVHPYHVAGSFVGFLIDRFGMAKVKQWYVNSTEAQHWFGKPVRTLEREWRAWLGEQKVADAHRAHVLGKLGISGRLLPVALRDGKGVDLLADRSLAGFTAEDAGKWSFRDGVLRGIHDGPWTHLQSQRAFGDRVAVRTRVRMNGDAVKLQCNRAAHVNEAVFAAWSTFVTSGKGFAKNDQCKLAAGVWHDVVLVHDGGTCTVYLNGQLVLEASDAPSREGGRVGIAVEKGTIEVSRLDVVELK
ncbi:MAG TPA: hypothetical protein VFT55_08410 [Planctomycetota bacterium]|nr:hypothetical protein [Planctomycetota bacterium]